MRAIRRITVRPVLPEPLVPLGELLINLRWTWHEETRELFAAIDPQQWERCHQNPITLLGRVLPERLATLAQDRRFLRRLDLVADDLREYVEGDRWYQHRDSDGPRAIAYFSPEFGITHVLPQYSGGLGILAGDHLKAASDLGVPVVGVGLLYRLGYFVQSLSREGWQQERYPIVDPDNLPLTLLREPDGSPARVHVGLPENRQVAAQIWVAQVGRVPLLLLDSNVEENGPAERDITDRLYGGGGEHRLQQEMLLGIGGVRALRAYCRITGSPEPEVYHTNEGHAGFLGLERIRELMEQQGIDFDTALEAVRAGTLFTTHTPVPAGIDRFSRDLVRQHFGGPNEAGGLSVDRILALGAEDYEGGDPEVFNMAVMGLRLAQRSNGVSVLHRRVSRHMFSGLWADFDESEVPIGSVTNGVHGPTWASSAVMAAAERLGGSDLLEQGRGWTKALASIGDGEMWDIKRGMREQLVHYARRRLRASWIQRGATQAELGWVDSAFDPDVLTIGFARRVPSYKRLTLMLRDPERLKGLLLHETRPIQIIIAGKAHPADDGGKRLIQEMVRFTDDPAVRHRIAFLPDYDMEMAQVLVPGCDIWLNNPLRPYEACGTSGMKAALNGGLNLSILDGWWDEWYDGENGWAIPSAEGAFDVEHRDELEAAALYELLETTIVPRFYDREGDEPPTRWLEMVRHTMATLGPKVQATRMVRDYVNGLYTPAALSARRLNTDFDGAKELAAWKAHVRTAWDQVRVDHIETVSAGDTYELGGALRLRAFVSLGPLSADDVDVQVVYGRADDNSDEIRNPRVASLSVTESYEQGRHRYEGEVSLDRAGPVGYTIRILPSHRLLSASSELGLAAVPA